MVVSDRPSKLGAGLGRYRLRIRQYTSELRDTPDPEVAEKGVMQIMNSEFNKKKEVAQELQEKKKGLPMLTG